MYFEKLNNVSKIKSTYLSKSLGLKSPFPATKTYQLNKNHITILNFITETSQIFGYKSNEPI